jgi:hypothetical protein
MTVNAPIRIHAEGVELSPAQYRFLFPDLLAGIAEGDDAHAHRHYVSHGEAEIARGARIVSPDRLAQVRAQRLSPGAPDATPSDYFRLAPRTGGTLDLCFSYTNIPRGKFNFTHLHAVNSVLFLNSSDNDFYQRGIPGVTASIDETAEWIRRIASSLHVDTIRTFGGSSGGYAAALFGALLNADAIYAFGPLFDLGGRYCRSTLWNRTRSFDPKYRNITALVRGCADRCNFLFPTFNLFEYHQIAAVFDLRPAGLHFSEEFHPGGGFMDFAALFSTPEPVFDGKLIFGESRKRFRFSREELALAEQADTALWEKDFATARALLERLVGIDADHVGFRYFLGVTLALTGERDRGRALIARTMRSIPRLARQEDRKATVQSWKERLLEDFGGFTTIEQQKQVLEIVGEAWDSPRVAEIVEVTPPVAPEPVPEPAVAAPLPPVPVERPGLWRRLLRRLGL